MLTTLQFLELFLCNIHECVEELLPGVAALLAEVIPEGSAQILVDHPEDEVVLLPEDAPGVVVAGDLSRVLGRSKNMETIYWTCGGVANMVNIIIVRF